MKKKEIICHVCKEPILDKNDLAVVGNAFITYHDHCFEKIKTKNIYTFYSGYKSNGLFPWVMLILLNTALWGTYYLFRPPFDEVLVMSLFISAMILFYRIASYLLYERYLN